MIDHVSIGVRNLFASMRFYESVLSVIGLNKLVEREGTVGFGKRYPEFWLNARPDLSADAADNGTHVCLRARDRTMVEDFHAAVLANGGRNDGAPGFRPEYNETYFAAFVRDPEGNRIEVVTFIPQV